MVQALRLILGLCVCLLVSSCEESEKERLSRLVSEWEGKEILFPAHSTFSIQGKDTVDFDFKDSEVLSDIALANVEALADEEWIGSACWWVSQYTICDYVGYFEGCPCGSHG